MYSRFLRFSRVLAPMANHSVAGTKSRAPWGLLVAGASLYTLAQQYSSAAESVVNEVHACAADEMTEGIMKKVQVGENEQNFIVLAKVGGQIYAVSGKCSHYGAPMQTGYLDGYTMICPWHLAQFDIRTGEKLTGPGLKSLATFPVEVRSGQVYVKIPVDQMSQVAACVEAPRMVKRDLTNRMRFVIVGGGAAGEHCAETLRIEGFTGEIVMLTKEDYLPYDRILLTKNFKLDSAKISLRSQGFFDDYGITVKMNSTVTAVDPKAKQVTLSNGTTEKYDKLLLATGTESRIPAFYNDYTGFSNVVTIRSAADHIKVKELMQDAQNIVIIGGSFIGLEVATNLRRNFPDKKVTIIEANKAPLANVFGSDISQQLIDAQKLNGVEVLTGKQVKQLQTAENKVISVSVPGRTTFLGRETEDKIATDVIVLATGATMQTAYAPAGILAQDGSVKVNAYMQTALPDIYAAGDIASFYSLVTEAPERLEHWAWAQEQGKYAALNMMGKGRANLSAPFFWSNQFTNVGLTGFSHGFDTYYTEVREDGAPDKAKRLTYFFKDGRCIGVAVINVFGSVQRLKIAIERGLMPSLEELVDGSATFETIMQKVKDSNPVKKPCCKSS